MAEKTSLNSTSKPLDASAIKKKSVGGAVSFFVRTLILNGLGFVSTLILGGLLEKTEFAVYGVVTQIIGILTFFSDIGLASALIQKKSEPDERDYQTIFWTQMALSFVIVLICFGLVQSGVFASQLGSEGPGILYALAFGFVLATLKVVPSIKLTRALDFSRLIWPQILEQVTYQGLLIILVLRGVGVAAYTYAIWARGIIGAIAMLILVPFWPRLIFSGKSFLSSVKYGCKFQLNDLLARVKDQLFYLFVASNYAQVHFGVTPEQFGIISFAKQWSMYPYNLTVQNVMSITFPTFSRLQGDKRLIRRAIEKSIYFITLAIFPILTGMCVFFWPLTQVIPAYHKWEDALVSFVFFTLAIAPAAISSPLTNVLNAIGKINDTLKLMVLWTVLTWIVAVPLLKVWGFDAVAIASFLISLTSFLPVFMVKKYVDFNLWDQIWRQLTASLLMAAFGLGLMHVWTQSLIWTLIGGAGSSLVYALSVIVLGRTKLWTEVRSLR
ncbi:oligosaccharide flippase family protein [bacterium]|nr:oligosaccharide flippase family protein [bacterium]